ncbi:hypothetical protein EBZ38_05880, partial [bacterium]|nr:hypothetical protein [bacterium]
MASTSNRALLANYLLGQQSSAMGKNYISNPSAFMNTVGTSVSGSATIARNTTSPLTAISDFSISLPNNATDYVAFSTDTFDSSMSGKNCELRLDYTASSIGSNVVVQIVQGSNIVASSSALSTASTARTVSVNAPCGDLSTATTIRVANSTGNSGTSALKVANVTYGLATNLSQVSQAQFYGSYTYNATGSCSFNTTGTLNTWMDFTSAGTCTGVAAGNAEAPATTIPGIRLRNLPPGRYQFVVTGQLGQGGAAQNYWMTSLTDGTNRTAPNGNFTAGSGPNYSTYSYSAMQEYTSVQSDVTMKLQGYLVTTANGLYINSGATGTAQFKIEVYRFPSTSELAYRPDQVAQSWTGYHTANCEFSRQNTSYGDFAADGSCSLMQRSNTNMGTVTTTGATTPGIVFTPNSAGKFRVCARDNVLAGGISMTAAGVQYPTPFAICGDLVAASVSPLTVKLQGKATGSSYVQINPNTLDTESAIEWSIINITQSIPAPLLVGSVTSNSSGLERVERARVTANGSSCAVTSQSGSWLASCSSPAAGQYLFTINSGIFSVTPFCSVTKSTNNGQDRVGWYDIGSSSSTSLRLLTGAGSSGMSSLANDVNGEYSI